MAQVRKMVVESWVEGLVASFLAMGYSSIQDAIEDEMARVLSHYNLLGLGENAANGFVVEATIAIKWLQHGMQVYDFDPANAYNNASALKVVSLLYAPLFSLDDDGNVIPEALQHDKNLVDLASLVGCPVYNVGCNYVDGRTYYENCLMAIDYLKNLIDYARES